MPEIEKDQDKLTEYATVTRYPGDYEPISLDEAKMAVRIARHVRRQIRKLLPKVKVNLIKRICLRLDQECRDVDLWGWY